MFGGARGRVPIGTVVGYNFSAGPVSRSPCALLKQDFLTNAMHLLYALVRTSSFCKAQDFMKPAPGLSVGHIGVNTLPDLQECY